MRWLALRSLQIVAELARLGIVRFQAKRVGDGLLRLREL
jgi:hypothetical protein